jgi:hypothetical protein
MYVHLRGQIMVVVVRSTCRYISEYPGPMPCRYTLFSLEMFNMDRENTMYIHVLVNHLHPLKFFLLTLGMLELSIDKGLLSCVAARGHVTYADGEIQNVTIVTSHEICVDDLSARSFRYLTKKRGYHGPSRWLSTLPSVSKH